MFFKKTLLMTIMSASSCSLFAQGLLLNDQSLRTDLNWLNQQGVINISTSTWPLSGDEVERALSQAHTINPAQEKVLNAVRTAIDANKQPVRIGLSAGTDQKTIPQTFGDTQKAQSEASVKLNAGGNNWDARLQVNAEHDQLIDNGNKVNVEGSYIAGKLWNQWVVAGQIPTWWGPGHDGSLIRGDASRPVYGFTMQRNTQQAFESKWLSWIGPWQYQLFAGQLNRYKAVPHARLIGMRVTAQPLPYLELGASRTIQIGGAGQPDTFKAYWNALIGNDNSCDANGCINESNASNQLGGFDARLNLQPLFHVPVGIYGQMIGEDEAGGLPSKYLYLAGMDFSSSYKNKPFQLYTEWADTRTNGKVMSYSYNHHQYTGGYYQHGYPLGDSIGGDGQMFSIGGDIRIDFMNRLSGRALYAKVNQSNLIINEAFPEKDNIKALDLTWTHYVKPYIPLKLNAWVSDSDKHGSDTGASIGVEFPLDFKAMHF